MAFLIWEDLIQALLLRFNLNRPWGDVTIDQPTFPHAIQGCCLLTADTDKTRRTEDGFELHMGINFVGHYALVRRLLPLLRKTASEAASDVRVVAVASSAHAMTGGPLNLRDLNWENEGTKSFNAYAHSKVKKILFRSIL